MSNAQFHFNAHINRAAHQCPSPHKSSAPNEAVQCHAANESNVRDASFHTQGLCLLHDDAADVRAAHGRQRNTYIVKGHYHLGDLHCAATTCSANAHTPWGWASWLSAGAASPAGVQRPQDCQMLPAPAFATVVVINWTVHTAYMSQSSSAHTSEGSLGALTRWPKYTTRVPAGSSYSFMLSPVWNKNVSPCRRWCVSTQILCHIALYRLAGDDLGGVFVSWLGGCVHSLGGSTTAPAWVALDKGQAHWWNVPKNVKC